MGDDRDVIAEKKNVIPYLGESVFFNIFKRLPAHNVYNLRKEFRLWSTIPRNSDFIDANLLYSKPGFIAVRRGEEADCNEMDLISVENEKVVTHSLNLQCRSVPTEGWQSCNGLVLIQNLPNEGDISVGNPVTRQLKTLPPCTQRRETSYVARAIVFVESTREYKLVWTVRSSGCEVLTLGSDEWKWVSARENELTCWVNEFGFRSVKGVVHWLAHEFDADDEDDYNQIIISFDAFEEKFYETEPPNDQNCRPLCDQFHEIDGCLSVGSRGPTRSYDQMHIWLLKDLKWGVWVKHLSISFESISRVFGQSSTPTHLVATLDNNRIMILDRSDGDYVFKYYIYNIQLKQGKPLEIDPEYMLLLPHVESLVSF